MNNLNIMPQALPENWKPKTDTTIDERKYVVKIFVNRAFSLDQVIPHLLANNASGTDPSSTEAAALVLTNVASASFAATIAVH